MLVLRDPALASRVADAGIRSLVEQRFAEVLAGEAYDYDQHGYFVVVEPGDTVAALEQETNCPILRNIFDEARYGNPAFSPSFEILEEHDGCYEMLFINNDSGFGITLFIPKAEGIEGSLLAMCAEFAVPAIRTR
ncbi:MAG: hypothetical protein WCR74_03035 [Betaproteobacteria bacterium]